jgi:DNA-binding NtrC family response regulator
MKYALILEKDDIASARLGELLGWLGYGSARVDTAEQAVNVASAIKFDVIVTCTTEREDDRRSLPGELKRAALTAAVILITDDDDELQNNLCALRGQGVSAVIARPASVDRLRRIVEFGLDGCGLQPPYIGPSEERRKPLAPSSDGTSQFPAVP